MHQPQRRQTIRRYLAVQRRYKHLYEIDRIRYDDVIATLCEEFFIESTDTVERILRTSVPALQEG